MASTSNHLSSPRLAAFVSLEIPMATCLAPLVVYIPAFYAGEMGLGLTTVGIAFGLTKLWDIVTDPILGPVTDRYGPPKWRRRFWLLVSLPFMLIGVWRVFLPPEGIGWEYFAFWMVFLYIGWTLLLISHISWGIELSSESNERARVAAFRQAASLIGAAIVVFIPVVTDLLPSSEEGDRIRAMGLFSIVLLAVFTGVVFLSAGERESARPERSEHKWSDILTILKADGSLRALMYGNIGLSLGLGATTSVLIFYVEDVLRLGSWATFALIPFLFSGLLFLPAWHYLRQRLGNSKTYRLSFLVQLCVLPIFLFIPAENLAVALTCFVLLGANHSVASFLPQAMIADLKDVSIQGTIKNRTGSYIAVLQTTSKVAGALAVGATFYVLSLIGFDPDPEAVNTGQEIQGLRYLIVGLPAVCYALGWLGMRGFRAETQNGAGPSLPA